jgi:hypothetical protein
MLETIISNDSKKKREEDDYEFSLSNFVTIINLAFESFLFPLNTLLQLIKFNK